MNDYDSTTLAGKLQRIADHERGLRKIPHAIRSAGRTRAFAAFYRRYGPKADPWLFHKSHGRAALRFGLPELLLTTTGAKSGLPRTVPLIYVRDGSDFMVLGTNFGQRHHPGWTANLLAHPDAFIEVGPERLAVTGELASQPAWERLWPRFVEIYPGYADYLTRCAPRKPRMFRLSPAADLATTTHPGLRGQHDLLVTGWSSAEPSQSTIRDRPRRRPALIQQDLGATTSGERLWRVLPPAGSLALWEGRAPQVSGKRSTVQAGRRSGSRSSSVRQPAVLPAGWKRLAGCCASGRCCRQRMSRRIRLPCRRRTGRGCSSSSRQSAASSRRRYRRRWLRNSGGSRRPGTRHRPQTGCESNARRWPAGRAT